MVKYTGIHHLAMATPDMDATIRFCRDLFVNTFDPNRFMKIWQF